MKTELEQLLNSLIKKGWKPGGKECTHFVKQYNADMYTAITENEGVYNIRYTLRDLVSKESGLRQFVCENGMIKSKYENYVKNYEEYGEGKCGFFTSIWDDEYRYRLIESALTDESELESFILDNIKIDPVNKKELERLEKLNDYEDL